jgi:predicted metal-dependent peptidase
LKNQLVAAYQRIAKNKKLQKELNIWDEAADDYINKR